MLEEKDSIEITLLHIHGSKPSFFFFFFFRVLGNLGRERKRTTSKILHCGGGGSFDFEYNERERETELGTTATNRFP